MAPAPHGATTRRTLVSAGESSDGRASSGSESLQLVRVKSACGVHLSSLLSFCHHGRVLLVALSFRPALSGAANRLGLVADLTSIRLLHTLARSRLGRRAVFYLWTAQSRPIPVQSLGQLLRFYVFFLSCGYGCVESYQAQFVIRAGLRLVADGRQQPGR